jgi:hypothetical protein
VIAVRIAADLTLAGVVGALYSSEIEGAWLYVRASFRSRWVRR